MRHHPSNLDDGLCRRAGLGPLERLLLVKIEDELRQVVDRDAKRVLISHGGGIMGTSPPEYSWSSISHLEVEKFSLTYTIWTNFVFHI